MALDLLLITSGLVLLYFGGDLLVIGSVRIASHFKISPFAIGATIMGFGTSAPELCVSLLAAFQGSPEISLGNVMGSNIANIGLVLGITALIAPISIEESRFRRETPPLLIATALFLILNWDQFLGRWEGLLLIVAILFYVRRALAHKEDGDTEIEEDDRFFPEAGLAIQFFLILAGLAGLVLGAHFMVEGAVSIARSYGISEWLIGISIVAVGTSLPEIVSSTMSAYRGHGEMALGNVFGSNIFNITLVLGATSAIHPLTILEPIRADLIFCGGITLFLLLLIRFEHALSKRDGMFLLIAYGFYLGMKSAGYF